MREGKLIYVQCYSISNIVKLPPFKKSEMRPSAPCNLLIYPSGIPYENKFGKNTHYFILPLQGVTYCGESKASKLTMENVPWHSEVVHFSQKLADMLPDYEIAAEHEHSNCILIANTKVISTTSFTTFV